MPLNAPIEYFLAEKKYLEARTDAERLAALEEMLSTCPKHKGAENKLREIKSRIAKLKEKVERAKIRERQRKSGGEFVRKQGIQIVLIGPPNSGKTKLFNCLTGAGEKATEIPFETQKITPGITLLRDVKFQILDTPSITDKNKDKILGLAKNSDLAIILGDLPMPADLPNSIKLTGDESIDVISEKIFAVLDVVRVYTKPPNKDVSKEAIALPRGSTVRDLAKRVGKDFVRNFKFARIWGSAKFPGQQVSWDHILCDGDIVEIHTK